ncbi:hypothetical protein [Microbacterium sp.]|uniref:hypothetical protein n=1 Tax=Microbacterium sp. TaxID=51671 RepID=UPI0039E63E16
MNRRLATPLLGLAALALVLPGCAAESSPTPTSSGSASKPAASASASATPSAGATGEATADCLVGEWYMGQDELTAFYQSINEVMAGSGVEFSPVGSATMTMDAAGTYSWAPSTEVTAQVSGVTILVTFGGSMEGTYTATADRITSSPLATSALEVTATIDGVATDPGAISEQIAQAPVGDAAYTCTTDTLTLTSEVAGGSATSVFHRR